MPNCTIGQVFVQLDEKPEAPIYVCDSMEPHAIDWSKEKKIMGKTAIPCGEYDVEGSIRYEGAPDLVIEILSPSSRSKDQLLKLYKYSNAGVREYWIVDPKYKIVTVHRFEEEEYTPQKYDFEDKIPVGISDGKCVIDFARVGKRPFR